MGEEIEMEDWKRYFMRLLRKEVEKRVVRGEGKYGRD